jgi:hypothetical protein
VSGTLKIGILWCTFFQRRGFWRRPLQLRDAYRPPSLFASKMRDAGHSVEFLVCDDILQLADLDGTTRTLQDSVDVLYVMTHGTFSGTGYDVYLHAANWLPGTTGIGNANLTVAIFDTCELIDSASIAQWQTTWGNAGLGVNLRLLLGFDGSAVIDRGSAARGKAFADNLLGGSTFADAWIKAVHSTTTSQYRRAVAIGVGDTPADAQSVLTTAGIASMPAKRGTGVPSFQAKY